jgi:hypothetical protein
MHNRHELILSAFIMDWRHHGSLTATTPATSTEHAATSQSPSPRHHLGFWLAAGAFLVNMGFSAVPTPLYSLSEMLTA